MNQIFFLLVSLLLIGLAINNSVVDAARARPARTPIPDAYQEYIFNLNQFYNDRKQFESDKSKYIAYKTVQAREDALESTKFMLESARVTLYQYIIILEQELTQQDELNSRVKKAILADLNTHKTFLVDSEQTISSIQTLDQSKDVSNALQLRYTYIKASATHTLTYTDAVIAKRRNDRAREIVSDFKTIVAGYPSDNKDRETVEKWSEETLPQLAENENLLNELIETMYPADARATRPYYEAVPPLKTANLVTVTTREREYIQRFQEINKIAKSAYREL